MQAFPVLCRILTELKLLSTQVGIVVLSAGVANDVVGWILLALCVAIVNAGSGITALYVLLTCVGYVLFLVYAIRPAFVWLLKRSGSLDNGPTQSVVALTVLMVFASAFFTGIIGVHPIFGAFLMGLICPHEGGFAIRLTEKIEDLVSVFFLPLYFALSGLSTNLGLLNNGITWAYVIGVIAVAFIAKVVGGTLAARANKLLWRESFTIGVLMSCKGLVELIVLVSSTDLLYSAKTLIGLEHWFTGKDPKSAYLYHFCRNGFGHHLRHNTHNTCALPALVPKEARCVEAGRYRLGREPTSFRGH